MEHGSFDLIYAVSVFTHLTDHSTRWLLELHRALKPDGLLIATFMGRWTSEWFAKEPWVEDRVGRNVLYHHRDWDSGGPAVLISEWWLREHWGRVFEVVNIASEFQNYSWAVLRRRDVEMDPDEVDRPSDDRREVVALRHNIRQVQREVVAELEAERVRHEWALADRERRIRELDQQIAMLGARSAGGRRSRCAVPRRRWAAGARAASASPRCARAVRTPGGRRRHR